MTAHILSYRRIRRYLALSLKATEEHVTLVMWDPHFQRYQMIGWILLLNAEVVRHICMMW